MDEQKKQKILLAALAVAALGAGSYFFLLRDSGGPAKGVMTGKNVGRKTRESTADKPERRRAQRSKKRDRGDKVATVERKERKERTKTSRSRKTRRGSTRKEKKKQESPAA